ncbi:MAG: AmmeMemoRadiSam system radical SAM enzyme [Endomicrobia bacterium]|nr:AmmeMemoRadiSam system radical SAM enzyme [Endomicrobiia bacterium]MCX7716726.1 AmmeMemoRadiSam system radical SAM enzyme [Endomicrobiia bacterium]
MDTITSATKVEIKKEAMFYQKLLNKRVQCFICFRECIIPLGKRGFCFNRENRDGILYNIVYSKPSAVQVDPIEKEPVYHFLPSSNILCIGTAGCNFKCKHCHNWHLSQQQIEEITHYHISPEDVVKLAKKYKIPSISFTYNDPISFYEYMYDIAKIAKKEKIRIIWHTNATINEPPLKEMLKYTDAVTVDLKGFTEEFYKNQSLGKLQPVLNSLKIIKQHLNVWLEIVNLVIPTLNDNPEDVKKMCQWIKENLGEEVPLHFTRFYPTYKTTHLPYTPIETLETCYKIAKNVGLKYVYIGNVPGHKYNSTYCPGCDKRLIYRIHFEVLENNIKDGKCKYCKYKIAGIWE